MDKFEEILAGVPQELKMLEIDTEKRIFKLNGVDFGDRCECFEMACEGGEDFIVRMEFSQRIVVANYGFDNALMKKMEVKFKE